MGEELLEELFSAKCLLEEAESAIYLLIHLSRVTWVIRKMDAWIPKTFKE